MRPWPSLRAAVGMSLLTASVGAQVMPPASTATPGGTPPVQLEPLVVTAQKRGQSIDEVPIAITAYTGATLETFGVTRYQDLAPLVPGMFVSVQSPSLPGINLRG